MICWCIFITVLFLPKLYACIYHVNNNLGQIQKGTMFDGISYLGSASITHPKDKTEILRIMAILNGEHVADQDMKISVSIPISSDEAVM